MIIPPIMLRLSINSPAAFERTLLIKTPNMENTIENPKTKNIVFRIMFTLLIDSTVPFLEPNSVTVVPEIYARNAGIIGKMHGATKEPSPASMATKMVSSAIRHYCNFSFKGLSHIFTKFYYIPF